MPFLIDIERNLLQTALEKELASQKRLKNTTKQPEFVPIVERVINGYMAGIASIREAEPSGTANNKSR